ncbi:MAG: methyltransferase [Gemmatimonadetes bacterium]|nr:methyltransferase [Gemmatimonadota bacterium]NIT86422.1 methyltransferase [Gemmatimonadota bacterium]NIU30259.1 methyltransferase [Gemmatimonadota bacterium]NIV60653.1 methyltransferase [Gemmatimonadota bacterium]NIW63330.1 methyltransferase [Gemmatimonadota bacterium]
MTSPGRNVRPTAEEVRDRWLRALEPRVRGARVLDLFAGCGALGLEGLSRGAAACDFVENGPASLHALKANVAALRAGRRARVFKRDAIPFLEGLEPKSYDLAFADPPYGSRKLDRVVERWLEVPFAAVLTVEHARDHRSPTLARAEKRLDFGDTRVSFFEVTAVAG